MSEGHFLFSVYAGRQGVLTLGAQQFLLYDVELILLSEAEVTNTAEKSLPLVAELNY